MIVDEGYSSGAYLRGAMGSDENAYMKPYCTPKVPEILTRVSREYNGVIRDKVKNQ